MKWSLGIIAAALLAAGSPSAAQPDLVVTAAEGYELRLMGGGLASGRRGLHSYPVFLFGISRTEALSRVAALRGRASATGVGRGCDGPSLNFARFGMLTLWFRNNIWVGWSLTGPRGRRPIDTEYDLGIGTPRGEIDNMDDSPVVFRRTRRGTEFEAQGMQGLLSGPGPRAQVVAIRSGETCAGR